MSSPGALPYRIVDVFTSTPFAGNPLAVVFDAAGLTTEAMQAIAREFNLSETSFVLPVTAAGESGDADYRLRIFTPSTELPFAGHPSVGGCWAVREAGIVDAAKDRLVQECAAGLLPLDVLPDGRIRLTGGTPHLGEPVAAGDLLEGVRLSASDRAGEAEPRWCGCGIDFAYLQVRPDALAQCRPDIGTLAALGNAGVMVFAWDADRRVASARVFAAGAGVPEDPATGSAALGLGVWLVSAGLLPADGSSPYDVVQGVEMGRPSQLSGEVHAVGGQVESATVTGAVVPVGAGTITPPAG